MLVLSRQFCTFKPPTVGSCEPLAPIIKSLIKMENFRLYWEFHKSTIVINWAFSIALSVSSSPLLLPVLTMTGGPLISLFYKEISRNNEYYFYYNRSISKVNLIAISLGLNVFVGFILLFIMSKCQIF